MNASTSPHGFTRARGRGYRPEQVDHRIAALFQERDDAWERAARLTVLANELDAEADALRERVARLAPQTYESLGGRARSILALTEEQAYELRDTAAAEAAAVGDAAGRAAHDTRDEARAASDRLRAAAEEAAHRVLTEARAEADGTRSGARADAERWRAEAAAALEEMRRRTDGILADLQKDQADRWDTEEREIAAREAAEDERFAVLTARAEAVLGDAKKALAEAGEAARHRQEDAEARSAEIVAEARVREERVERETERVLREHEEEREEVQAHMAHVRSSLAGLTGRTAAEG
ncbi:cellulose-binding protein [Streptomyces sp. NPDC004111]|uniref:cellulose-binding protein n=1 Tax=Streptomyces sp. NPDC004111 TaxID=3364690 RepID=UPI0036BA2C79